AAIDKLDHVVETGVTAIELMPIADFAGRRNWGYDGVLLYAPDSAYGRPDDLRMLIDEAHARGLMVFLDVVYNHFGPEGNYLHRYAPAFFARAHTPWGHAIDYRVPEVRAFAIGNALHWLEHYRFDGLRLDAVHALLEAERLSLLHDLSRAVGQLAAASGRLIHLVLENDDNCASLLDPLTDPAQGKYRAQWNDDYHHAWHRLLTGEERGYYQDYAPDPRRPIPARASRACYARASPIRARPHLTDTVEAVGSHRAPCRPWPSSIFSRTTIRSVTAPWAIVSQRASGRLLSRRRSPSRCLLRCRHFCSWGKNGDQPSRFLSFAISRGRSRMPSAKADARNSRLRMRSWAMSFPTPSQVQPC